MARGDPHRVENGPLRFVNLHDVCEFVRPMLKFADAGKDESPGRFANRTHP
jgi:hypothetical protein